ncbi:FG-GAP-like repeat-containing protein [Streptomyces pinistramenti]|uniref:FG-GAP-like repeat-containing protein n=1 Tax=Streptomyces pinistramenti TaxID=2884812 RepID=UPI001D088321|nr:FG-GAP-like repeat-containing protein [Streptomyces pinistramenti]MCB5906984.1 FG-GAP-like repeat-containing protein [Streptomyces pinistramenti]
MRNRTRGAIAAGIGTVVAGALAVTAGAVTSGAAGPGKDSEAAVKKSAVKEDFNGDGYNDLAIGAPGASDGAGSLAVVYGSAHGLDPSTRTVIDAKMLGIPDVDGRFADKLAARDLDGDGVTDLAVQVAGGSGDRLIALWGAKGKGLSAKGAVRLHDAERMAAGDFNGDGKQDLFVTEYMKEDKASLLQGPFTREGKPAEVQTVSVADSDEEAFGLTAGDINGDGADDVFVTRAMEESARPGAVLLGGRNGLTKQTGDGPEALPATFGDFNGDGKADLAYREAPGDIVEGPWTDSGTVKVRYGTRNGLGSRTATFTQATPGVPGANEKGDVFGASLAAGEVDGDGRDELAVGVPGESIGSKRKAGSTVLLKGSADGLTGAGAQAFSQDTAGVPGVAEAGDEFGGNVRLLDINGDGRADLADSAPGENAGAGAVWSVPGSSSGLDTGKATSFAPGDLGAPATRSAFGDNFNGSTPSPLRGLEES